MCHNLYPQKLEIDSNSETASSLFGHQTLELLHCWLKEFKQGDDCLEFDRLDAQPSYCFTWALLRSNDNPFQPLLLPSWWEQRQQGLTSYSSLAATQQIRCSCELLRSFIDTTTFLASSQFLPVFVVGTCGLRGQ